MINNTLDTDPVIILKSGDDGDDTYVWCWHVM